MLIGCFVLSGHTLFRLSEVSEQVLADIDAIAAIRALFSSPFSGQLIGTGADFGVIPRAGTQTGPSPDAIVKHTLLALSSRFLRRSLPSLSLP